MSRLVVLDGLLAPGDLLACSSAWPGPDWPGWVRYDQRYEAKAASDLVTPLPPALSAVLARVASLNLGAMLGMPQSVADLSLHGGGLHAMGPGVGLGGHLDADTHARLGLARAWSAALYVHPRWCPSWGGAFWAQCEGVFREIEAKPGRLVAFGCRELRHGVRPVRCPEGVTRRSLALFGYLPEPGAKERPRAVFDAPEAAGR